MHLKNFLKKQIKFQTIFSNKKNNTAKKAIQNDLISLSESEKSEIQTLDSKKKDFLKLENLESILKQNDEESMEKIDNSYNQIDKYMKKNDKKN